MRWFRIVIGGRASKWAHLLDTEWRSKDSGRAVTACDVRPYDHTDDPLTVGFVAVDDTKLRCPKCAAASTMPREVAA